MKNIYQAPSAELAEDALAAFESSDLGRRYAYVGKSWRNAWEQVIPFFSFSPELRRIIYATNCIEGLNRCIRKSIKTRGSFPNDDSAKKLAWLAMKSATKEWSCSVRQWQTVHSELLSVYGSRYLTMMAD